MGYWRQAICRSGAIIVSDVDLASLTGLGKSADLAVGAGAREKAVR